MRILFYWHFSLYLLVSCSNQNMIVSSLAKNNGSSSSGTSNSVDIALETKKHTQSAQSTQPNLPAQPIPPGTLFFSPDVETLEPLSWRTRIDKVAAVTSATPAELSGLTNARYLLGDYDYSKNIQDQRLWSEQQIKIWIENLLPACTSSAFKSRYAWPDQAESFFVASLGRILTTEDNNILAEIQKIPGSPDEKRTAACLILLSSLEFQTR